MAEPFLSEIRIFSFNFAPKGWAMCNGQLLPINQNQALFSLLGTTYGGDGQTNFALPNLQGRVPVDNGTDPFGNPYTLGQRGGEPAHTLTVNELPAHVHTATGAVTAIGNLPSPANNVWAANGASPYGPATDASVMNAAAVTATGGSQPHSNLQPYLVLVFCIALQGIFPSQN